MIGPLILLLSSAPMLMWGGMMLWDLMFAYGVSGGPDALASRHGFLSWLLKLARADQHPAISSKWVMWWRTMGVLGIGVFFLSVGIINLIG